ncbi:iron uptake system protein EfeO [Falsirhodobacter sp. alg1]|uniref:iron uptake system protein EfeO n=1 Tax=Falsirhodobacter sp. alg1 TaxID=1472418 RepID=UPI0005EE22C4|nr:iron uptake system protein EfeO [Falsirhodobacter sp. alg1]
MSDPSRRMLYVAIAASGALAAAGFAAFAIATSRTADNTTDADRSVTVTAETCQPNAIEVPGGLRTFEIINTSDRPIEWEILDGVMVVAERENIAPGFRQTMKVRLTPGTYAMTCGLLSNPRGTLTVLPSEEAAAAAGNVTLRSFLGPLSEYRVYLSMQGAAAIKAAETLRDAIAAGDIDAARAAWQAARAPYRRIEPLAFRLSDLANTIDPQAAFLELREDDPAFTGFHRIEYALFDQNSLEGLQPVADRLVADLTTLRARLHEVDMTPDLLMALPADMSRMLAESRIPNGEDTYAATDAADLQASLDGVEKLTGLLTPLTDPVDAPLAADIRQATDKARAELDSDAPFDAEARARLAPVFAGLAETLGKLPATIGVD